MSNQGLNTLKIFPKREKNNCLNCAFCLRERHYWRTGGGYLLAIKPKWEYDVRPLTDEERELLKNGDSDFIGKKIRDYDEWKKKYEEALEKKDAEIDSMANNAEDIFHLKQSNELIELIKNATKASYRPNYMMGQGIDTATEKLGIDECPSNVPDKDFLSCHRNQWNENKSPELQDSRGDLGNKKCSYFYPYKSKGEKTLDACIEGQKDDKGLFAIKISSASLIVAILALLLNQLNFRITDLFNHKAPEKKGINAVQQNEISVKPVKSSVDIKNGFKTQDLQIREKGKDQTGKQRNVENES